MKKGFTLIELLVVVGIISFVAGISIFSVQAARERAQDDKRLADMRAIQSAFTRYNADCFSFPNSLPTSGSDLKGSPALSPSCASNNTYLRLFPTDPNPSRNYYYAITESVGGKNVSYILCAALTKDNEPTSDVTGCGSCGANACNIKFTN